MTVREMRERVRAASALLDEIADALPDDRMSLHNPWAPTFETVFRLRQARQRVRLLDQELAKHDDPRENPLPRLKRLVSRA